MEWAAREPTYIPIHRGRVEVVEAKGHAESAPLIAARLRDFGKAGEARGHCNTGWLKCGGGTGLVRRIPILTAIVFIAFVGSLCRHMTNPPSGGYICRPVVRALHGPMGMHMTRVSVGPAKSMHMYGRGVIRD